MYKAFPQKIQCKIYKYDDLYLPIENFTHNILSSFSRVCGRIIMLVNYLINFFHS